MTRKKRRIIMLLSILAFVIIASLILFYSQGYSLDNGFQLTRHGGLYVSAPMPNCKIFVNNKSKKPTGFLNSALFLSNSKIGDYSVLIAKDGFWPWAKTLNVEEGMVTEARAVLIPENPNGEVVFKGKLLKIWTSPYQKLLLILEEKNSKNVLSFFLPDKNIFLTPISTFTEQLLTSKNDITNLFWDKNYLIFQNEKVLIKVDIALTNNTVKASYFSGEAPESSDFVKYDKSGKEKIWWNPETNEIFVDWLSEEKPPYYLCQNEKECKLPEKIFQSWLPIKNTDFFPKRKDVILLAVGNGVYALEIDGRSDRLLYPIYKGKNPYFASFYDEDYILVADDGSLLKIYLK